MPDLYDTVLYDTVLSETVMITGSGGDLIEAYACRPLDRAPRGGVVVIHHMPGYDRQSKEAARRIAQAGYNVVCPNLYWRVAPGADPDDAAATARAAGGKADDELVGDVAGASAYLKGLTNANGKVATIGYCSGGRQSFLCAASLPLDAAVICYGGFIVGSPPPGLPMVPILDRAPDVGCELLGLFGDEDTHPSPEDVATIAAALDAAGKTYEFHSYPGAGHSFFSPDRPSYRPEAAVDGWGKVFSFFDRTLGA